jgi:hypothetical protein
MAKATYTDAFEVCVVIEFGEKCSAHARNWLNTRLRAAREKNGAELLTRFCGDEKTPDIYLLVSATNERLLRGAEQIALKKLCKDGLIRDFMHEDISIFDGCGK